MISKRDQDAALLEALFAARGQLILRSELARLIQIPIADLDARVALYQEAGYPVEIHPQGRIGLHEPPDIWCAEEILGRCHPHKNSNLPMWDPVLLAETTSTNTLVREQARKGARSGFLVAAAHQTAGRGRLGRTWESPTGLGLYLSILLRPDYSLTEAGKLTILSSVAMVDAVEMVCSFRPQIKWPNDIMVENRKLAGVLIETEQRTGRLIFAVIGVGLNLKQEAEHFSPQVRDFATSLYLITGKKYRRADLLVAYLQALERRLSRPFDEVREAWSASSLTLGQRISLTTLRGVKHGQALGLDDSGALLLRTDSGEVEVITAGDMQAC